MWAASSRPHRRAERANPAVPGPRCGGALRRGALVLGLPEGDLTGRRRGDDAAPARRTLAGLEQHPGPQAARPVRDPGDVGDLDVGQPQRTPGAALDDATAEPAAELEGDVRPGPGVDPLRAPP